MVVGPFAYPQGIIGGQGRPCASFVFGCNIDVIFTILLDVEGRWEAIGGACKYLDVPVG